MKKLNLLIATVVLAFTFTSCSKDTTATTTSQPPVTPNERLLLSSSTNGTTYSFTYNADKTMKSYTWANGLAKADFSYQPNNMKVTIYSNNILNSEQVYELDGGLAQKLTYTSFDANGMIADVYVTVYTYNAGGKIANETYTKNGIHQGEVLYTYDVNNELSVLESKNSNGIITWRSDYEYDQALLDKSVSFGQFNTNGTGSVFPRKSNHLIKKQVVTQNNTSTVLNFIYTIDASGYVLSRTTTNNMGVTVDSWTNTWQ